MSPNRPNWSPRVVLLCLVALFAGCGREESAQLVSVPEAPTSSPESKPLVILTWDEYFSEGLVAGFEKKHGIPVEFVTFSNLDEMEALLRSRPTDFDLLVASGGVIADLIELEMLQPVRRDLIQGFGNLDEKFLGLKFDPENRFSVPYMWGTTLIAYRSDKIEEPERNWKSLWDPRYRDRVLMVDDGFDLYAAALFASGHDLNTQEPSEIDRATTLLLEQVEKLHARFVDIFEVRDALVSGDCWIGMSYSSDAAVLAEEEANIAYFIPEEGAPLWVDSFVIPRESTNSGAAHLFLDYLCLPEVAAANSNELWCASANREVRPFLDPEVLEDETLYLSPEVLARCRFEGRTGPDRQLRVNQGLKKVFDRLREAEAKPRLSLLIWDEYLAPEAIERFENGANARVVVTEVSNSEELKQSLASKPCAYDVVVADEVTLDELVKTRLVRELDAEKLDAPGRRTEPFLATPTDPEGRYTVPYLWGMTVLAGRREALAGAEPSWNLLWREDLRVAVLDEPYDLVWLALLALGHDPENATAAQIDEASSRLRKRFPDLPRSMMDLMTGLDALEAGEIDLLVTYNGDALSRAASSREIEVILPREGAPLWLDSLAISRDAPNAALGHRFIAHMASPEISALTANTLCYATPNPLARPLIDPRLTGNERLYPSAPVLDKCAFVRFPAGLEKHVNQAILEIVSEGRARSVAMGAEGDQAVSREARPDAAVR